MNSVTVAGEVLLEDLFAIIISDLPELIQYATAQLTYSTGTLLGGMGLKFNGRHLMENFCAIPRMSACTRFTKYRYSK